jgi:beta-lactamase superfamily II metal-dependent hydrolase
MPDGAVLTIAGPTEEYYSQLAPRIKAKTVETEMRADADLVDESDDTDPFNNSSVITVVEYDGRTYLFTADAGPASFLSAIASSPVALADVSWMQIPHHGSKRNVTSILIDHFCPDIAYVSATGNDSHPNPSVIRLFQKAGCAVYGTYKSGSLHHHRGELPPRPGYVTATPLDENAQ